MEISFEKILKDLFPSLSESSKDQIKQAIQQLEVNPKLLFQFDNLKLDVYQGDTFSEIQFVTLIDEGKYAKNNLKCMIISHTCDFEKRENILIAPIYPIDIIKKRFDKLQIDSIKKNFIYDKIFLPYPTAENGLVVDLNGINSVRKSFIKTLINKNKLYRLTTFSQIGFYFFIIKLTVHFLRRENTKDIQREKYEIFN